MPPRKPLFHLVRRIEPAAGAMFAGRGDLLLVWDREPDTLELLAPGGFERLHAIQVERLGGAAPLGDAAVVLRRAERQRRNPLEVRGLPDLRLISTIDEEKVTRYAGHPDASQVAVGHDFGSLNVWDAKTGALRSTYTTKGIAGVAYSDDGALLAAKQYRGELKIFAADKPVTRATRSIPAGGHGQIAFLRGRHTVAVAEQNTFKLIDADTGATETAIAFTRKQVKGDMHLLACAPDGKLAVTAPRDGGAVALWDLERAELHSLLKIVDGPMARVQFDASGKLLLIASYEATEIHALA